MHIAVVGLTHKTAPVDVREQLSIPEPQLQTAIAHLLAYPHIKEVAILSTCNRLEIYFVATSLDAGVREVVQFLSEHSKISLQALRPHLFTLLRQDAGLHLMRVASGLDSLVLGEGQILAQVKTMQQNSQKFKGVGRILDRLLKQALTAGKRVRTETSIGTGAVSISSAAVELAQLKVAERAICGQGSGCLSDHRICILGAGKMSRLVVKHMIAKGGTQITVVNRSRERADKLAEEFKDSADIQVALLDEMMRHVGEADLVFAGTFAEEPLLDRAKLEMHWAGDVVRLGGDRQIMLFDISVPRNIHADVNDLEFIQAFNVDDLKEVVSKNQAQRRQMAMEAQGILDAECAAFDVWWHSLETVPTINSLREKVETIRTQELEKALSRLGSEFADKKHQEIIEALTRGIVNKILHDPMTQLRAPQDDDQRQQAMTTLRMLFNLEEAKAS
ncbi:MAG: glutamyl-tRNA reductase [Synechococcales cyanobacterium CRU_2_2]|nr:glutamyl-tRNA reductase [Synechococcales cyanobacterium CRU_2_2]